MSTKLYSATPCKIIISTPTVVETSSHTEITTDSEVNNNDLLIYKEYAMLSNKKTVCCNLFPTPWKTVL
jgi:hypothetical protein